MIETLIEAPSCAPISRNTIDAHCCAPLVLAFVSAPWHSPRPRAPLRQPAMRCRAGSDELQLSGVEATPVKQHGVDGVQRLSSAIMQGRIADSPKARTCARRTVRAGPRGCLLKPGIRVVDIWDQEWQDLPETGVRLPTFFGLRHPIGESLQPCSRHQRAFASCGPQ